MVQMNDFPLIRRLFNYFSYLHGKISGVKFQKKGYDHESI